MSGGGLMRVFRVLPVGSGADMEDLGLQAHGFVRLCPGKGPAGLVPLREAAALAFAQDSQLRDFAPGGLALSHSSTRTACLHCLLLYFKMTRLCTQRSLIQNQAPEGTQTGYAV